MKTIYHITTAILCLAVFFTSCKNDERASVNLSEDTLIHSFEIDGTQGTINNKDMTISILMPPKTDLTQLTPTIQIAEGATITPASGETTDFSQGPVTYTVINGNVYNTYTVTADVVKAQITKFTIDNVDAVINQYDNKILIVLPTSTPGTQFAPIIEYTEGATMTPASGDMVDFASPVTYTLTYAGATFTYEATLEKSDRAYAFLGVPAAMSGLTDPDEIAAAEWMMNSIPNSSYISFDQVKNGSVDLTLYDVIWWHYDDVSQKLPAIAGDITVVNAFKAYYQNGGRLFLSTFACLFVANVGIAANGAPNNTFGDATPFPAATTERWGISITGHDTHPIYQGLRIDNSKGYPIVYLSGIGAIKYNNSCLWNLEASPYNTATPVATWVQLTGGTTLGSLDWDSDCSRRVAVSEFTDAGGGITICIGGGSYDWYSEEETINNYKDNIEKLSKNIIEYLAE